MVEMLLNEKNQILEVQEINTLSMSLYPGVYRDGPSSSLLLHQFSGVFGFF